VTNCLNYFFKINYWDELILSISSCNFAVRLPTTVLCQFVSHLTFILVFMFICLMLVFVFVLTNNILLPTFPNADFSSIKRNAVTKHVTRGYTIPAVRNGWIAL